MKKIIVVLLCVIMLVSLSACGGNDSSNNQQSSNETVSEENNQTNTVSNDVNKEIATLENKYSDLTKDELKWEYNSSSKTIVISGKGPMRDYDEEAPEWDEYYDQAENVVVGDEVTSIGAGAFLWFNVLTNVELGESIEFIGDLAFNECPQLTTINFPTNLKYIGEKAFNNDLLHADNVFVFPEGMLYLGEESFRSAFKDSFVSIPASLTYIDEGAFANCYVEEFRVDENNPTYTTDEFGVLYDKNMTALINFPAASVASEFEVPGTVTTILEEAIETTNYLTKIVIPASVTKIEEAAIFWNYALTSIDVDQNNNNYKSVDGVLYTKDGKVLLSYPIASDRDEYTVAEGCERIGDYSLSQAMSLTKLHIHEGVKEIGEIALYFNTNLKEIGLPKSLKEIEENTFAFCYSLTRVDFLGSSKDWDKVEIDEGNEILTDGIVTIYCAE